ncbi:hypothetical protein NF867_16865 [Solitalea sp. MAHUQ-68]|uniref:Uncharacterized protein n=1 Tax=Solitalea agri TaxID=2953739 RepID=A0A9X2F4F7_9SPHI|nr:hypothetical protein [Solitalea agri]MCO4294537.1 hypothetical protein [Solitalea agri]
MKKVVFLIVALVSLVCSRSAAQVSVNVSIGTPPMWAPYGYTEARYYYLPDVECYYDVVDAHFIYNNGNAWVRVSSLPARYRNYDLYAGYKVVLEYNGANPYRYFSTHRARYPYGYCGPRQVTYREYCRHEDRYRHIPPGHWKNGKWRDEVRYSEHYEGHHDRGHGHGKKHHH